MLNNPLIEKALQFATEKHKNHTRQDEDKSPYIVHPIAVRHILSDIGGVEDAEVLVAAAAALAARRLFGRRPWRSWPWESCVDDRERHLTTDQTERGLQGERDEVCKDHGDGDERRHAHRGFLAPDGPGLRRVLL